MIVVYRNLYSWDFWPASVKSVRDVASKVVCFMGKQTYGPTPLTLEEATVVDHTDEMAYQLCDEVYYRNTVTPVNEFTILINEVIPGDEPVMIIDPDMVWRKDQLELFLRESQDCAGIESRQIEIWKGLKHRVPERPLRQGAIIWNARPLPQTTHLGRAVNGMHRSTAQVHNLGFALSEPTMRVKDSIAKRFSPIICDSTPNPNWINRWINWKPGDTDLEISAGCEHDIPHLLDYDPAELPETLR